MREEGRMRMTKGKRRRKKIERIMSWQERVNRRQRIGNKMTITRKWKRKNNKKKINK